MDHEQSSVNQEQLDPEKKDFSADETKSLSPFKMIRSLTRLSLGGLLIGSEEAYRSMQNWDRNLDESIKGGEEATVSSESPDSIKMGGAKPPKSKLVYGLIGAAFESQDTVKSAIEMASQTGRKVNQLASPITTQIKIVSNSRIFSPVRDRFDTLASNGEKKVNRWIARGEIEYGRSKQMAQIAYDETTDVVIENVATNPDIQELIEKTSFGLATEVVEEIRERTVSADTLLEGIFRRLFRRIPRSELPPPPEEVIKSATHLRSPTYRYSE